MNRKILAAFLIPSVVGCAAQKAPVNYVQAQPVKDPEPAVKYVEVAKPMPLPGQLRPIPTRDKPEAAAQNPRDVIKTANRDATQQPNRDGYFNAMMTYDYMPGALYQAYTVPLKVTDIALQPGEKIIGKPAAGDTVRWVLGVGRSKAGNLDQQHVYIKPMRPNLDTNLAINTDRRVYNLELHSYDYKDAYMVALNWRYPQDEFDQMNTEAAAVAKDQAAVTSPQISLDKLNFHYGVAVEEGNEPVWMPTKVFDDGQKTFIQFPRVMLNNEAPALFVLSDNDETQLVNYRVKNDFYIVDRLFDRAELRVGQQKQTIVRISRDN